jgi:Uma2 family endonuclease
LARHRYSVAEYYRMVEIGIFARDARVELIEGELIDMERRRPRHASATMRLSRLRLEALAEEAIVSVHGQLRLDDHSEPEPDLMLLKPREDFYAAAHPTVADVLLLIEVADTSARYDREIKLPLYARHGVPEVWIVDLDARLLCFFRSPVGESYADTRTTANPGATRIGAFADVSIDLAPIFG